jgi:hypothetical protein
MILLIDYSLFNYCSLTLLYCIIFNIVQNFSSNLVKESLTDLIYKNDIFSTNENYVLFFNNG